MNITSVRLSVIVYLNEIESLNINNLERLRSYWLLLRRTKEILMNSLKVNGKFRKS